MDRSIEPLFTRGMQALQRGALGDAETVFQQVLAQAPEHPAALHFLGLVRAQTGRSIDALALLRKSIDLQPRIADFHLNLGEVERAAGNAEAAAAAYRNAIDLNPDLAPAWFGLAECLSETGAAADAVDAARRGVALVPDNAMGQCVLADLLSKVMDLAGAAAAYRAALELQPDMRMAEVNLAAILRRDGRISEAIPIYERLLEEQPEDPDLHVNLADALAQAERPDEAIEHYQEALARNPGEADGHYGLGNALTTCGRLDEAVTAYQMALRIQPNRTDALAALGLVQARSSDRDGAEASFAAALAVNPRDVRSYANRGLALEADGRPGADGLFDYDRLFLTRELAVPDGWPDRAAYHADLRDAILGREDLIFEREATTTMGGAQTGNLFIDPALAVAALQERILAFSDDYRRDVIAGSQNPFLDQAPAAFRMIGQAVVLDQGGFQRPHVHPTGFLSGVYYVQMPDPEPDDPHAGWFRLGRGLDPDAEPVTQRLVQPKEGLIVMFPSYFWHATVPFRGSRQRICVAFDLLPA